MRACALLLDGEIVSPLPMASDLSILEIVEGAVSFVDTRSNNRVGKLHLRPAGTVVAGVAFGRPYQAPFTVR